MPMIQGPGKFEGEHTLTRRLWQASLNGTIGEPISADCTEYILAIGRVKGSCWAVLVEGNCGFVSGHYFGSEAEYQKALCEVSAEYAEALSEVSPEF